MNYLQQKQKAKGLIVLVDIKHSHLYNWKLYFFLTFPFFGSKIQHFSTFGSNQDDHDIEHKIIDYSMEIYNSTAFIHFLL